MTKTENATKSTTVLLPSFRYATWHLSSRANITPMPAITFDFLIEKRPVSLQTKSRANLQAWKTFVAQKAAAVWPGGAPLNSSDLRLSLVYLCDDAPADIDNIIKPIQDALVGVAYEDDSLISDVDSHRRYLSDPLDITDLPELLQKGAAKGEECVYVRVSYALELRSFL